jgi:negative regulator of flagellin synthesis FlgM
VVNVKIWGEIPKILGIYDKQKNVSRVDKTVKTEARKDVISISNQAKDSQTAMRALKEIPDIRQEKVNELFEMYQSGKYDVSGKEIAGRVVKSILDKKA